MNNDEQQLIHTFDEEQEFQCIVCGLKLKRNQNHNCLITIKETIIIPLEERVLELEKKLEKREELYKKGYKKNEN